ncbi:class I SAM-dependent methyltransferase [candidate division KSB1 bacterium]|nr:MAG: class I SAM-dependent methyltransferase [candidate division KSB1 bacterium]MBC6948710.1 class I SAM-dependent methyltransferase [candidate division KSB1 bacterium]MCE7945448.1 class I SAM-dependent methyltransferase [Chlorobi bacterium CHB1]MDL1878080.1 class I SAM-dependent methyltransferase [Cytophagia bacterium CHB2]
MQQMVVMNCRLCAAPKTEKVRGADERVYYLCPSCRLIGVAPQHFLSAHEEKARYLTHNNGIAHQGYVDFLRRAVIPALPFLKENMLGLDYGCGYAPTLSILLAREGYRCDNYDPYFVSNDLNATYDFIFSTEVFEHFRQPRRDIEKIVNLLRPEGILVVMTARWADLASFRNWYYTRDASHVAFYHDKTFTYLCDEFGFQNIFDDGQRILLLRKI